MFYFSVSLIILVAVVDISLIPIDYRGNSNRRFFFLSCFFLQWMQQSFRNTSEDHVNSRLAYILHEDLCSSFEGDTLLAIRAPPHTHLEVPTHEDDQVKVVLNLFFLLLR